MARPRKTLEKWIAEALAGTDKEGTITHITLMHMSGMAQKELHTVRIGRGGATPEALAELFRDKAESYAQDLPGAQTFNLLAFYGKSAPESEQPFIVPQRSDPTSSGLATEQPTEQGQTQQNMRQREMVFSQMFQKQAHLDNAYQRMNDMLVDENLTLRREVIGAYSVVRDMMLTHSNNQHEIRMKEYEYQRSTSERAKLFDAIPPLVNQMSGREIFPQETVDTQIVNMIAGALKEEHIPMLQALGLPQEAMGLLMSRLEKAVKDKRVKEERERALPAFKGDPEKDITGGAE